MLSKANKKERLWAPDNISGQISSGNRIPDMGDNEPLD